jgi:hypothetical protein
VFVKTDCYVLRCVEEDCFPLPSNPRVRGSNPLGGVFCVVTISRVLIRYHFDYELARISQSKVLAMSKHDPSIRRPSQGFAAATWAASIPRPGGAVRTAAGANSCAAWQSCRRLARRAHASAYGCDPYSSSSSGGPREAGHAAGSDEAAPSPWY